MSSERLSTTFPGDNIDKQTEETKADKFPISWEWHIFTLEVADPILTLLSRLLRHACKVRMLLLFVPL
jgi:hypothetical protein